ncbi:MAG TPA: GntR family transcriptional regulator [Syntrophomonadaceae bacterium]|nr:GntR family transcriptional regulator [Syntrophomonadaceae bacterium]
MHIILSNASPDPIYEQIRQQIRSQILHGDLSSGDALPSIRNLAQQLQISVITSKRAYEELERDGFIETVSGKGSFVAVQNPELLREKRMSLIENRLAEIVRDSIILGVSLEELREMLEILYKEV